MTFVPPHPYHQKRWIASILFCFRGFPPPQIDWWLALCTRSLYQRKTELAVLESTEGCSSPETCHRLRSWSVWARASPSPQILPSLLEKSGKAVKFALSLAPPFEVI